MLPVFVLYPWLPVASNSECLGQKFVTPEVTAKNILIACGGRPAYGDYPGVKDWNRQPEAVSLSHNVAYCRKDLIKSRCNWDFFFVKVRMGYSNENDIIGFN